MKLNRLSSRSGFTLLEIMLVVVIIGMLITVAVVKLSGQSEKARLVATRHQIDAYKTALGIYDLDNGLFPTTEQGLNALITQPPNSAQLERPLSRPAGHPQGSMGLTTIFTGIRDRKFPTALISSPSAPMVSKAMRMTLATGNKRKRSGFTLIELSIALFIMAIIMAVSIPSFIRSYYASLLDSTGRTVITSCQFAKLNAVLHQQKVEFYIDLDRANDVAHPNGNKRSRRCRIVRTSAEDDRNPRTSQARVGAGA